MNSSPLKLRNEIEIAGRLVSDESPVYIIAEMACAHQGNFEAAVKLLNGAKDAGADCVQIQIFDPAANMAPSADTYPLLEKLYFSPNEWRDLMVRARQIDIAVSIFAYDEPSLALAVDLEPDMLKLNSSELSNPAMLIGAAKSGLPFTLGTGASTLEEIRRAISIITEFKNDQVIMMHGMQNFPTRIEDANIRKVRHLKNEFGGQIIFADHTDADLPISKVIDLIAIGEGARLLEKHIILDRIPSNVDSQSALEPREFKAYVQLMRTGWSALGRYSFGTLSDSELSYRRFQKKSAVAACDLTEGSTLTNENVKFLRVQGTEEGIAPADFEKSALGKRLNRSVNSLEQILSCYLDE